LAIKEEIVQRHIPARASRFRPDAITESIPITDEDSLYRVRTNTSVRRYNSGVALEPTRIKEEAQSGRNIASFSFWMIALGLVLMAFCFAIVIVSIIMPALQKWHDDQAYGFPRTTHASRDVGHGGISDFTGINLNGYLYVIEIQEGDPTKLNPHIYFLVHVSSNQVPITSIMFADENNDGKLDMIVQTEDGTIFTFYNDGTQFKKQ
jgi:hypothetical protein